MLFQSKEKVLARVIQVEVEKIEPNPYQPRRTFDDIDSLAQSIKQNGLLQPLTVRRTDDGYQLVAGERRLRAAKMLGMEFVPCIPVTITERNSAVMALIENIQRENLNPIEEAIAYKRLLTEFNLKQDEVAERVSKSRTAVTNSMRLLKLCDEVQQMVIDEKITTGHARALLAIDDGEQQITVAQKIIDEKLSVRDIEKLVKNLNKPAKEKKATTGTKGVDYIYLDIEEKLKESLGTKVSVTGKENGAGKIEIEFYSNDDLERLLDILK
mgnify:CR=1 FL=1